MKNPSSSPIPTAFILGVFLFLASTVGPAEAEAQEPEPEERPPTEQLEGAEGLEDVPPPPGLTEREEARSRMCVAGMARLQAIGTELDPVRQRSFRLEMLYQAVALEDSVRVSPLGDDPLEARVREWFGTDEELARQYLETEDEEIVARRREARDELLDRIREAHTEASLEAQGIIESAEGIEVAARDCDGAIFVRSAVLEACEEGGGPLCDAARAENPTGPFRFVDEASALWDIEQIRFWSEPVPLQPTPDGGLGGARTATMIRRGNIVAILALEPMIQSRSAITEEEAAEYDRNLEILGFEFDHPGYVMAPTLSFEVDSPGALDGETHYLLHFGDLSDPQSDVVWAVPTGTGGPVGSVFPAEEVVLVRMAQGHELNVTAVRIPETEGDPAEPVFSLGFPELGQGAAVTALLQYMGGGQLSADLAAYLTPEEGGEESR